MLKAVIQDGRGTAHHAQVTSRGELVVGPVAYSTPVARTMGTAGTPVNFFGPKSGQQLVITAIHLYANKNVGASDAAVEIYGATAADTATVTTSILNTEMQKNSQLSLTGLQWIVNEGEFLNGKTDDDDVFATVAGYYVAAES